MDITGILWQIRYNIWSLRLVNVTMIYSYIILYEQIRGSMAGIKHYMPMRFHIVSRNRQELTEELGGEKRIMVQTANTVEI